MKKNIPRGYALCVRNDECDDLELRKVYPIMSDSKATKEGFIRVIDDSGEAYLYPESFFIPISLPQRAQKTLIALAS
ncbi:MAG TPA: hypothetical protein PKE26_00585 [Kiritimatiellia bacterium]|nr:hypothetical protein [Kiritimatiellia bacterium]HMO97589.1 hypothetical protein [Kiritimatiellia bacterium]HMP96786.1 hypothetical protein [Kiritimatiellia bacterium]